MGTKLYDCLIICVKYAFAMGAEAERARADAEARSGYADRALGRLAPLDRGGDNEATFLMARIEEDLGRLAAARERLLRLRARMGSTTPLLEIQLASVCQKLGDNDAAIAALESAIALDPAASAAHKNLAAILTLQGRMEEVRAALKRAVAAIPDDAGLWLRCSAAESHFGNATASIEALQKAVLSMPSQAIVWRDIGYAFAEHWRYDDSDRAYSVAAALDPGEPDIESTRAFVKQELGDTAGALAALQAAAARAPGDLRIAVNERLMLPQVYDDAADMARWRSRFVEDRKSVV